MAIQSVPNLTDVPPFPALSDRAAGTYNTKAFLFGTHMADVFNGQVAALAANVHHNATEAAESAATASGAAQAAIAAAQLTQDASGFAESALASKAAADLSENAAAQSASSAAQSKASVDASLAQIAGGPVASINGLTGIVNIKVPTTGDVVVSARGDYSAPAYLPCDGGTYLRSSYPALAAMIPIAAPTNKMTNPSTSPGAEGRSIAFSGDGNYVAVGLGASPFLKLYKRSGDTLSVLSTAAFSINDAVGGLSFSNDGVYIGAAGYNSVPYLRFFKRAGDTVAALADVASPGAAVNAVALSPNGVYGAAALFSGGIAMYKRSVDTWSKIANAETANGFNCVAFDPSGTYLAAGSNVGGNYLRIYKRSGDTFAKLSDPASLPAGGIFGVAFSPDGLCMAAVGPNGVAVYKRDGDTFTRLSDPDATGIGTGYSVAFSSTGILAVGCSSGQNLTLYRRVGDAFLRLAALAPPLPGTGNGVAFSPDGSMLVAAHPLTPYLSGYVVGYNPATLFKLPQQTVDGLGLLGYIKT